jgi:hypothetical protein
MDDPMNPAPISETVAKRIRRGVIHEKPFVASHARAPATPAAAVVAPIMHWVHMGVA